MSDIIGSKIKELRTALGLTQEELGDLVGVKKAAINKYESGLVQNIKRDMQLRLAEALHTDPAALFYPASQDSIKSDLSGDEQSLIDMYRDLNPEGQKKLTDYADDLVSSGKYGKRAAVSVGESA